MCLHNDNYWISIDFFIWRVHFHSNNTEVITQEILKTIDLCIIPIVTCYLALVIYENKKIIKFIGFVICVTNIVIIIMNLFSHFVFYISKDNQYIRTQYWDIFLSICVFEFIFLRIYLNE